MRLTNEQVAGAAARIAGGETSIRREAEELGVNESTLRRRLSNKVRRAARTGGQIPPETAFEAVEVPVIHRDYSDFESIRVYPIGDLHVGSPAHDRTKLDEWLDYILGRGNATILNTGDNLNAAILGSKSDSYAEELTVQEAIEDLEDRLNPVANDGRLDVLTGGNHEARIYRATGIDPMRLIARHLGVDHYEGAAVIIYHVGDQEYTFWVRHGTGNAPASMNAVTKAGYVAQADIYLTGHTHRQSIVLDDFFTVNAERNRMVRQPRRYVTSGSFVRYERYAAERGYAPSHLGAPRIFLDGRTKDAHVSV